MEKYIYIYISLHVLICHFLQLKAIFQFCYQTLITLNSLFAPAPPGQSAVTPGEEGWPPAIPPPHVLFAPDSSYLLDALVPVSLPFFFLFPLPSFSCCWLFSLLWSSGSRRFRSPPPVAGHLLVLTAPFSHRHLPQWCFQPDLVRASLVDRLTFYFSILALFPIVFCFVCFPVFWFCFCFVCVLFLQFCRSPLCQFCCPPPIARRYSAPPHDELQTHLPVVGVCLNAIGFSLYFLFPCICFFPIFLLCFCL